MPDDLATAALLFRARLRGLLVAEAEAEAALANENLVSENLASDTLGGDAGAAVLAHRPQAIDPWALEGAEALPGGALLLLEPPAPRMEWRLYARSSEPARRPGVPAGADRTPFSLDGVLPAAAAPDALAAGAFRLVLQRDPDQGGLDHHLRALRAGQPPATMMRSLLASREALDRGEQLLLVLAAAPAAG